MFCPVRRIHWLYANGAKTGCYAIPVVTHCYRVVRWPALETETPTCQSVQFLPATNMQGAPEIVNLRPAAFYRSALLLARRLG